MSKEVSSPLLQVQNIQKKFQDQIILKDLSLNLYPNEILGVLGSSGSGKSVFLRSLIGLEHLDQGKIIFKKQRIDDFSEEEFMEVRKKISYSFQYAALFDSMSVFENIAFPLRCHSNLSEKEITEKVHSLLTIIGMLHDRDKMPASLSGGMKKRVGLARSIVHHPDIILYDEPTAGLDPINSEKITSLILDFQKINQQSGIFVTHDIPAAIKVCQRIAIIADKKIVYCDDKEVFQKDHQKIINQYLVNRRQNHDI